MDDLIARLKAAAEGSRELDLAILNATRGDDPPWYWHSSFPAETVITRDQYGKGAVGNPVLSLEPYTTSIDDALMLVPEGWQWSVSNRAPKPHAGRAYLHNGELIYMGGGQQRNPRYAGSECTARTPALALCIAALKARSA